MRMHRQDSSSLVAGLVLITIGILFLFDRLEVISFSEAMQTYWPVFLIIIGISKLAYRRSIPAVIEHIEDKDHENAR